MIKNVVFDIGMVLADFRWRKYLSDDLKFPPEVCREIGEKIVQTTMWDDLDLGVRDADEVIEEMKSKLPQYRKETDIFFNGIENIARAYPYSTPWIQDLKSRGFISEASLSAKIIAFIQIPFSFNTVSFILF